MKSSELKNLSADQLASEEIRVRDELASLGLKIRGGQQKNVRAYKALRKTLAKILTFLTQVKSKNS